MGKHFTLTGTAEEQPDGTMRVIGVLAIRSEEDRPGQVQNLRLVSVSSSNVQIAWDAVDNAAGYKVHRDGVEIDDVVDLTFSDTVTGPVTHSYSIYAYNSGGVSDQSFVLVVDVPAGSLPVPDAPVLELVAVTSRRVDFEWEPVPNATGYRAYEAGVEDPLAVLTTQTSFSHTGLTPQSNHSYTVIASNASGDSAPSLALAVQTLANTPPLWGDTSQTIELTVGQAFSLDLNTICIDPDIEAVSFSVALGSLPAGLVLNGSIISGTPTASGSPDATIRADDGIDFSDSLFTFNVQAEADTTPPTAAVLGTPVVTGSTVSVPLQVPSTDVSGISQYTVSRRTNGTGGFALIATLLSEAEFPFVQEGLANGSYEYRVAARDASPAQNVSAFSNVVTAVVNVVVQNPDTPINFVAALISTDDAQISWSPGPSGPTPTAYDLEYSSEGDGGSASGPWTDFVVSSPAPVTHSNLPTGRTWYRIRALAGANASAYTSTIFVTVGLPSSQPDFRIPRMTGGQPTDTWDGSQARVPLTGGPARAVQAGDIIEFEAGTWRAFTLLKVVGTPSNPVTLKVPPTGQVIFRRSSPGSGGFLTQWKACRDFVLNGETTDPNVPVTRDGKRHGFKWTYADNATTGNKENITAYVKFKGTSGSGAPPYNNSYRCLFRYMHFDGGWNKVANQSLSTTAGHIALDTNDHKYKRDDFPGQWQESMTFEHFLAENLGGEATYFGTNPYDTFRGPYFEEGGAGVPLRYIKTRHFMIYNTGGQGIQYKSVFGGVGGGDGPTENSVHDGVIIGCTSDVGPATNGTPAVVLNSSKADVYNMWIEGCGGGAITLQITEGTNIGFPSGGVWGANSTDFISRIYNNVIIDNNVLTVNNGIRIAAFTGSNPALPAAYKPTARIFNNTIVRHTGQPSIKFENSANANGFAKNNLIVESNAISYGPTGANATNITNLTAAQAFVDGTGTYLAQNINLRLTQARLASGNIAPAGSTGGSWGAGVEIANIDFDGNTRSMPGADVGAYERA